jgi:hypothetical protein
VPSPRDVWVSLFPNDRDPDVAAEGEHTWEDFVSSLSQPRDASVAKRQLPLWSPARFRAGYRRRENVIDVSLLVLDVDEDPVPDRAALEREFSSYRPLRVVAHSSSRATATAPRWRVAIALSRPVTAGEYDRLWPAFTSALPFPVGRQSKDPSRAWYFPRRGDDGHFEIFAVDGEPLDVDTWLEKAPVPALEPSGTAPRERAESPRAVRIAAKRAGAAAALAAAWPEKGRHQAQLALAGALKHDGWAPEDALEFLCDVCRAAGDEDRPKREATIRHTWATEAVTGWSSLATHVDATLVEDVRKGLNAHADDMRALRAELAPRGTAEGPTPSRRRSAAERALCVGGDAATRLVTRIPSIDAATRGGFVPRKLVVVGGAPGAGKTAFLVSLGYRWLTEGIPVAFLAADEDAEAILIRLGQMHGLSREALENGERPAREALAAWCRSVPIILADADEDEDGTIEGVSRELSALAAGKPSAFIVDSIQTARTEAPAPAAKDADRRRGIDHVVSVLKKSAKIGQHVIAASSELARSAYRNKSQAENANPLAAFKESGAIEYGVSLAMALVSHPGTSDLVDAVVVKNRLGPGKPEFLLKLDHERAEVTEAKPAEVEGIDPLHLMKVEILDALDAHNGVALSRNALHRVVGGNKAKFLKACAELVDAHVLFEDRSGLRRPLPGEKGYIEPARAEPGEETPEQ